MFMDIKQPGGHLDQLIRQTRAHHVQLSLMADTKANMILTIASIVVSLSIGYLSDPQFQRAAMIMIGFCLLTVVMAAYAAMPKQKLLKHPEQSDATNRPGFNILFFGSFLNMSYPDYESAMEKMMNDHNRVYECQIREVYTMGEYLEKKKYRFVKLAYIFFITGAVASSIVYMIGAYV
jgi:hypothetical protein